MKVIWTARARVELDEIADYVAPISASAGLALVRRLRQAGKQLGEHPHMGRPGRVDGSRELVVNGTPYVLPYRVSEGRVEILAVIHTSRQWPDQL
ncbi:MAG: type II toxin-antitoxin system mRNA interferase toxin, RelE/StbE family [Stutzerimonas stutzeri]|jgi:plasmid stabilization system protein ParE|uniref:Type II toxin-antitoxin system RelE/ParE family toxin n=1 Tax=Bosea eneae TaxID=151454 RepID=A0ABW0IYG0_9HYPH|nr:MAG: type II toxin-antitoxin system mRNA interferase toxin, RelE/StbE family [Stutzerimonas stutzeri]